MFCTVYTAQGANRMHQSLQILYLFKLGKEYLLVSLNTLCVALDLCSFSSSHLFQNNSQDLLLSSQIMFQADQICYAVLCVFSYMAAGQERQQQQPAAARRVGSSANVHHHLSSSGAQSLGAGGLSPRGPGGGGLASLPRGPNFSEPSPRNIVGQT